VSVPVLPFSTLLPAPAVSTLLRLLPVRLAVPVVLMRPFSTLPPSVYADKLL
jgi:hypothetical protein